MLFATLLNAQTVPALGLYNSCTSEKNKDRWSIEKHPDVPGEYVFSYWNSDKQCSENLTIDIISEDGFRVEMTVKIDQYPDSDDEYIFIIPYDHQYMAYPPELKLRDGDEPGIIRLIPGIS